MLTVNELMKIARHYWFSDSKWNNSIELSPESIRFDERWRESLKEQSRWSKMIADLRETLPGFFIGSYMAACDASWRCVAYYRAGLQAPRFRYVLAGSMSIIAPVYVVYGVEYEYKGSARGQAKLYFEPFPDDMAIAAETIGRRLESHFGVEKLPQSVWETPVPVICNWQEPPRTTLFHALFTSEPENLP